MSTKTVSQKVTKKTVVPTKLKSKSYGTIEIKSTRMVFDDTMYKGKFVFRITERQFNGLKDMETRLLEGLEVTNFAHSENEFGHQLKISSDSSMEKGTYDLVLKISNWQMGVKTGISYKVVSANKVDDLPEAEFKPTILKSLGCLL